MDTTSRQHPGAGHVPLTHRGPLSGITDWVREHRLAAFFGLTFLLSWWSWPFYVVGLAPTAFFPCGPLVAALVVIGVAEGGPGYRDLGARMIRWRVGWTWWLVAVGTPLAVLAVAAAANVDDLGRAGAGAGHARLVAARARSPRCGSSTRSTVRWGRSPAGAATRSRSCRRGARRSPSGLVLAAFVALWHLPLVATGQLAAVGSPDHVRDHPGLRLAVQPHRRQRADDAGVPHRAGHVQLRRARVHRMPTPRGWTGSSGCSGSPSPLGVIVSTGEAWRAAPAASVGGSQPAPTAR